MSNWSELNRREFLRVSAEAGAGLLVMAALPFDAMGQATEFRPAAWVRIDTDGLVWITVDETELGQGVMTSLPMILADELEADWSKVRPLPIPQDPSTWVRGISTGGSTSIRTAWAPLGKAGAAAREMLRSAAAGEWGVPLEECKAQNGSIVHVPSGRKLEYGKLVNAAAKLPVPQDPPRKPASEYRFVGRKMPRFDMRGKVDGSTKFGSDLVLPGMLYAVVARPPALGAVLKTVDDAATRKVDGVVEVLRIPQGVAVLARSTWAALKGREALRAEWDLTPAAGLTSTLLHEKFGQLVRTPGRSIKTVGDIDAALAVASKRVEAEYEFPYIDHAVMEPLNATAWVHDGKVELWAPTQAATGAQAAAAAVAGVKPAQVELHVPLVGGGFGRRLAVDYVEIAVGVAKQLSVPVRVWYTREDTTKNGVYRPLSHHLLQGGITADGKPLGWLHRMGAGGADGLVTGGAESPPYALPNLRAEVHPPNTQVPTGAWRSVSYTHMGFVIESFIDELAVLAGQDPYQYRRSLMTNDKLRAALELVAQKAEWDRPRNGTFLGIAAVSSFGSHAAEVAEVSVDRDGTLHVHRITVAVHVGRVVNPDSLAAQIEGAITLALGYTLKNEITVVDGKVQQSNFHDHPILRINELPKIDWYAVPSEEAPTGIGEPPVPPLAPAIANAIFRATGKRIRHLPIRAEDLRQKA